MTSAEDYADRADKIADATDHSGYSPDLRSLVNAYLPRREAGETRAAAAFARAIVRRAEREGAVEAEELSAADLKAEIDRRNEGRDDDAKIKPEGRSKAAMQAALKADDENAGA